MRALDMQVAPSHEDSIFIKAARPGDSEKVRMMVRLPTTLPELCAQAATEFRKLGHKNVQFVKALDASRKIIETITKELQNETIHFISVLGEHQDYGVSAQKRIIYFEDLHEYMLLEYPEWSNTTPHTTPQSIPCIPLCWFPDKWHALKARLGKSEQGDEKGRITGLQAALLVLKVSKPLETILRELCRT